MIFASILALVSVLAACRATKSADAPLAEPVSPDGGKLARSDVLDAFAACVTSHAEEFLSRATELDAATSAFALDPSKANELAARNAWRATMKTWERVETMQIGPLSSSGHPGAANLREDIYSWPVSGRCLIEQALVDKTYETGLAAALVNTRGLFAAEYLLFYEGTDNACSPAAPVNSSGKWAAIQPELRARKAAYAAAVAKDLVARARGLRDAWSPLASNFTLEFVSAGKGSKTYGTDQMAFNAAADALFYLEYVVKDAKVGKPLGAVNCATATCPDDVESPYAAASKEHLRNNLNGARRLLFGCGEAGEGIGFDELLRGVGKESTANQLLADLDAASARLDAIPGDSLREAIVTDPAPVRAFYDALKKVTDVLKTEFISLLDLELPQRAEGDND